MLESLQVTLKNMPFKRYMLLCVVVFGVLFYGLYGTANWLTSLRATHGTVPEFTFAWERQIPFIPWMILPYWTLDVLCASAVLLCPNREQLHGLIKQFLIVQVIAVTCYLLFPLQFTWTRPETAGLWGALFQTLVFFDLPYNQAPSLHIILVVVLGHFYYTRMRAPLRKLWLMWLSLIVLSVLTTYQHHFIDIPAGLLVGWFVLWRFPIQTSSTVHTPVFASRRTELE